MNWKKLTFIITVIVLLFFLFRLFQSLLFPNQTDRNNTTPTSGSAFFPIGSSITPKGTPNTASGNTTPTISTNDSLTTPSSSAPLPVFRKLTERAIAGYTILGSGTSTRARYTDTETGNVFDVGIGDSSPQRITNTTLVRIHDSTFSADGSFVLNRFEDNGTILTQSYKIPIGVSGKTAVLEPSLFSLYAQQVVAAPTGNSLFYLLKNNLGNGLGSIGSFNTRNGPIFFQSPIFEWNVRWPIDTTLTLESKPSAKAPGYFYTLDAKTGVTTRVLGDTLGLSGLLSSKGTTVLYSDAEGGNGLETRIFDIKNNSSETFPRVTLPEKCVWSKKQPALVFCAIPRAIASGFTYPDDWYKGLVSFSDDIWVFNSQNGDFGQAWNPTKVGAGEVIDATDLTLDSTETYLFFKNKINGTLWTVQVSSH